MALLRPMYTQRLADRLQQGAAIWIHAPAARGGQRLLQDLVHLFEEEWSLFSVDLKQWHQEPATLVAHLSYLIQQDPPPPTFSAWVDSLRHRPGRHLLLLNHADMILGAKAENAGFDASFFRQFDQFSRYPHLALFIIAEQPLPEAGAGGACRLEQVSLPPLSLKRIREDLVRRLGKDLPLQALATDIFSHPHPYTYLEYVAGQWATQPDLGRLPDWRKAYDTEHDLVRAQAEQPSPSFWQRIWARFKP